MVQVPAVLNAFPLVEQYCCVASLGEHRHRKDATCVAGGGGSGKAHVVCELQSALCCVHAVQTLQCQALHPVHNLCVNG
jgi:hypothetical protein